MSPEGLAAMGAFLSGAGSLAAALLSLRGTRKKAANECEKRIAELRKAFRAGLEMEVRH